MTRHQLAVRDKTQCRIRGVLTDAELAAETAAGREMDLDALVADALDVDPTICAG